MQEPGWYVDDKKIGSIIYYVPTDVEIKAKKKEDTIAVVALSGILTFVAILGLIQWLT